MSEIQDVSDGQAAQPAETEVGQAITPVTYTGSAVVLDPIERVLVDLETKHKNVVFDLTTTKGDKAARQARKELVQVRTGAAAAYKAWNAPLLEEQRKARDRVKEIEQRVTVLEEPIDAQIKARGDWRADMLVRLRALVKEADPDVIETLKWRGVPVWEHDGIISTGETYKAVVKMTFARGASLPDPAGLFNSSLEGNVRRAIDFREGDRIDEKALKALIRAAVALNTAKKKK